MPILRLLSMVLACQTMLWTRAEKAICRCKQHTVMAMQTAILMIVSAAVRLTSLGQLPPTANQPICRVRTLCVFIQVCNSNVVG